jgi:hypothetical protein
LEFHFSACDIDELDLLKLQCLQEVKKEFPDAIPLRNKNKWKDCIEFFGELSKIGVYYDLPENGFSSKFKLFPVNFN